MHLRHFFTSVLRAGSRYYFHPVEILQCHAYSDVLRPASCTLLHLPLNRTQHLSLRRSCSTKATIAENNVDCLSDGDDPEVSIKGADLPNPYTAFNEKCFSDTIIRQLNRQNLTKPTTIQSYGLPIALAGRDLVGIGQTGSGKTLAYLLPALVHIEKQRLATGNGEGPVVLVLAPTRELAQQIQEVVQQFSAACKMSSVCLFGGVPKYPQISALQRGVDICIATPGRLIDILEMEVTNMRRCSYLVLDEADRMLDMGFEPQIREIIRLIPKEHQTLMWSATWPSDVRTLAQDFLHDYVQMNIGSTELRANPNISQSFTFCLEHEKGEKLTKFLKDAFCKSDTKVLLFCETKRQVDALTRNLSWSKFSAGSIHGDKSQMQRDKAIMDFKKNKINILIATDVAARGLDITDITHVVNFDFPKSIETYVHRIGRTARAFRTGHAYSFFTNESHPLAKELVAVLKEAGQPVDPMLTEFALSNFTRTPSRKSYHHPVKNFSRSNFEGKNGRTKSSFFERSNYSKKGVFYDD